MSTPASASGSPRVERHSWSESLHSCAHLGDLSTLDRLMEDIGQGAVVGASANTSVTAGTETCLIDSGERGWRAPRAVVWEFEKLRL